jgi:MSHA pilin protein MshC
MVRVNSGFTLVELIIVVLLLSILSVTTLPKILDSGDTDELTAQDQIISVLRRMQIQAMQQTNITAAQALADASLCHQLILTSSQLGRPDTNPCDTVVATTSLTSAADPDSALQFKLGDNSDIQLSLFDTSAVTGGSALTLPYLFKFNSMGKADFVRGAVFNGLRIEITDVATYKVCIETEGYIHPC